MKAAVVPSGTEHRLELRASFQSPSPAPDKCKCVKD